MTVSDQKEQSLAAVTSTVRWDEEMDLPPILQKVRPYTMVAEESLVELARQVRVVLTQPIPGALVECGTWRGGASFLMAEMLRRINANTRKVWMFDSFEGIPAPQEMDGAAAKAWANSTAGPMYFDNLRAPVEQVADAASNLRLTEYVQIVKGWFQDTLPKARHEIGPIALLRIDADWYDSVRCCLDNLFDSVVDGGFVIFDDYYTYDGCAVAVHEFLGARKLPHRIEGIGAAREFVGAVFRKGEPGWQSLRHEYFVVQQLHVLMRQASPIILVDENCYDDVLQDGGGTTPLPFLQHEGEYWGKPQDDRDAIENLETMRAEGAAMIAFAWPYLWWLDHYSGFARHLRSRYRCVKKTEQVVAFDLRVAADSHDRGTPSRE